MIDYLKAKSILLSMLAKGQTLSEKLGFPTTAGRFSEMREGVENRQLTIVTVGEMRRGKSSMLNALLGEKNLFPVDISVCTNVVTIVRYGESEQIEAVLTRYDAEGNAEHYTETITRDEIVNYVSEKGNPNNHKNVDLLQISIPNPLLKNGVVFVDTPGVGSLNIAHAEVTLGFLSNADLLLFTTDAVNGMTKAEITFLKQSYEHCKNILFPVTKMDLNMDYQAIMEDNRQKIAQTLAIKPDDISMMPINSSAKLRYLDTGNELFYNLSNYKAFENLIFSTIAQKRSEIILLPFVDQMRKELYDMSKSIAMQHQVMSGDSAKLASLSKELEKQTQLLEEKRQDSAAWRSDLSVFCQKLQNEAGSMLKQQQVDLDTFLNSLQEKHGVKLTEEKVYTQIFNEINVRVVQGLFKVRDFISESTEQKIAVLNTELGLTLDVCDEALQGIDFTPSSAPEVHFPKRKIGDAIMSSGRSIGSDTIAGSRIGMIAGGVLLAGLFVVAGPAAMAAQMGTTVGSAAIAAIAGGSTIGASVGSALGGVRGFVSSIKNRNAPDVPVVLKALRTHIQSAYVQLGTVVSNLFVDLRTELMKSFEDQIKSKESSIRETITQLSASIKLGKEEIPKKLEELKKKNAALTQSIDAVDKFRERLDETTQLNGAEMVNQAKAPKTEPAQEAPSYDFLDL